MPDEKSGRGETSSLFTGNAGNHPGDFFEKNRLIRHGDDPVRLKKRATLRMRTGTRRL